MGAEAQRLERLRILVADDESVIRMDLREMLEELGHEVVAEASTGEEVVARCRQFDPDIVFLDIKMPGMDGLTALELINQDKPRPVVILSAFGDRALVDKAAELGALSYLVKPFSPASLGPVIRMAIRQFEQIQALQAENQSLREAIEANKLINRAKALLMEHEGLSENEAFRKIQKLSMDSNKKMKEVAEAIVLVLSQKRRK